MCHPDIDISCKVNKYNEKNSIILKRTVTFSQVLKTYNAGIQLIRVFLTLEF